MSNYIETGCIVEFEDKLGLVVELKHNATVLNIEKFIDNDNALQHDYEKFVISQSETKKWVVNFNIISNINIKNLKYVDIVEADDFNNVLRAFTKYSSNIYYKNHKKKKKSQYISSSGKILDEKELFNMIDASLDMWLTADRFNTEFEKKLSEYIGIKHCLTVNSGSSSNLLAIETLKSSKLGHKKINEGDEVITVAAGFPTTINPIVQTKLIPVFVDAEVGTYNINPDQIEEAITDKTKAIFVAHTLGNPINFDKILKICDKYNLWLIEDNCDALGSRYNDKYTGTFGHIAAQSFYPAHHITTGEGGAIFTNDIQLYKIAMSLRDWGRDCWCPPGKDDTCGKRFSYQLGNLPYGYDHKYIYSHLGYNLKITDWQAAIGLAQIEKLPQFTQKRKENFTLLYEGLKSLDSYLILPIAENNADPSWFGFPITVKENSKINKFELIKHLENKKIGTRQLFAGNILRQPSFVDNKVKLRIRNSSLLLSDELKEEHYSLIPNTDTIMNQTFWIGVWPGITKEQIEYIIETFKTVLLN